VPKKLPIIKLYRDGIFINEASLRSGTLKTGKDWKCDLIDPSLDFASYNLLKKTYRGYRLLLPADTEGIFERSGSSVTLAGMMEWGLAKKSSRGITISIDSTISGTFTLGSASYELAFGIPSEPAILKEPVVVGQVPAACRFTPPNRSDLVFTMILLTMMIVQILAVRGLRNIEIPDMIVLHKLPRRIARLILEPVKKPPPPRVIKETEKGTEVVETVEKSEPPEPEEVTKDKPAPPPVAGTEQAAEGPTRELIRKQVSKVGILGVLTGKGTAGRAVARKGISALQLDDDLARSLDEVLSQVSGITITSQNETGTGFGLIGSGNEGLLDIEGNIDGTGVESPIKVSSLGDLPKGPTAGETQDVEEKIKPEHREERSARTIARIIAAHTGAIRYAYNRELRKNPALRGKVILTFTISPEGVVTDCDVEESAMNWPPLEKSLVRMVKSWKFPEIPEGDVTVNYPLVFFPSM